MNTGVVMGESRQFALLHALMIYGPANANPYGSTGETYVTLHDVEHPDSGPPQIGPGRPADLEFLRKLTEGLQASVPPEVLPDYVLCRTPDTVAWWSPRVRRPMFFRGELAEVSGQTFPQPALAWKIVGQSIFVRAMAINQRPDADTPLFRAPYWNTNQDGRICLGSMRRPGTRCVDSLRQWEEGFFGSLFTGQNGTAVLAKGGLAKLWTELAGARRQFPVRRLIPAEQTLGEFVRGGGRA